MQVSLQTTSELGRKLSIEIPEDKVQEKMMARLKSVARSARIDGFRPGKVPMPVVMRQYGAQVREDVLNDMLASSFQDAIDAEQLRPAGLPKITPKRAGDGVGMAYEAEFEVYPEVKLAPLDSLTVKRPAAEVTDQDLEAMVQRLREQRKGWEVVERAAQPGDQVTLNFEGTENGNNFTDGVMENFVVVLDGKQLLPDFEKHIVGASAGAHLEFGLTFPADYGYKNLAGKDAEFRVDLVKVEASQLLEINAEFVRSYGVESGDVQEFLSDVRENMVRELERAVQGRLKNAVMDALYEANPLTLPDCLMDDEIEQLMEPYRQSAKERGQDFDAAAMRPIFEKTARRRVALGLILGDVIQRNDIRLDSQRVRELVESIGHSYQQPEAAIKWYYAKPERLREVEHRVLEDQAVDLVLTQAKMVTENLTFDQVMKPTAFDPTMA